MYEILSDFKGANIKVLSMEANTAVIDVDLRDTAEDWFYWCFKVRNAGGKTITFNFPALNRVGYYGAAVSHDYENWHWQYTNKGHQGNSFTYTFKENEDEVYFAHDMLYRPERFFKFTLEKGIGVKTLCKTKKGNDAPYIDMGEGEEVILLTARHHACESTGSYVLEGALEEIISNKYFEKYRIICVPFVDYDGVLDGDQGKSRSPHDHNRDYDKASVPIYKTTGHIRSMAEGLNVKYAFDFHSPWHLGGENDTVFFPIKSHSAIETITNFSEILEGQNIGNTIPFDKINNHYPGIGWNREGTPTFATFFMNKAVVSCTLEIPYFCSGSEPFLPEKAINLGKNFVKAIQNYEN